MGRGTQESWTDKLKRETQNRIKQEWKELPKTLKEERAAAEIRFKRKRKTPGVGN